MKSTTRLQFSVFVLSAVAVMAIFAILALAPSIIWTSDTDWSTGTFANTTNITGNMMLNNTIVNK